MKKEMTKYLLKNSGLVFLINLVFAVLGLIGLVLAQWTWAQIAFGFIMVLSQIGLYGFFGYSESYHGALFVSGNKDKPSSTGQDGAVGDRYHVKSFAVWKGYVIPTITESLPFLFLLLGVAIEPMRRGVQVFVGIWYSSFATLANGFGASVTAPEGIGLLAIMFLPMVFSIVSYGTGYLIGGLRKKRLHRQLDVDIASYDL